MKKTLMNLGLLLMRFGFSAGIMTHGYRKFLKVIQGDFDFADPIGFGSTVSLILATLGEFIAPIFIIIGWKTRLFSIFPIFTMLVAFLIAHDGDPFSRKEKSLMYFISFIVIYFIGPGKYSIDKE
jgi:putative oxidoreductase